MITRRRLLGFLAGSASSAFGQGVSSLVTGSVYPEVERALPAYPFRTPRLVFRNLGNGRFEELIDEPNVEADQLVVVREGAGILRRQRFGS